MPEDIAQQDLRERWQQSYQDLQDTDLNMMFLSSLKTFFKEKSLEFSPILK